MLPEPDQAKVRIGIRWHTGATDVLIADRPLPPGPAKRSPSPAVEMVRRLGPTTDTRDLAERLNTAGLATGHGKPFDIAAVQWIRHAYKIPAPSPYTPGELSVAQAAGQLGCSTGVIYYWLKTGQLDARRGAGNRLCIPWTDDVRGRLPCPPGRIRAPQPRSPAHQAPATTLRRPKCQCSLPCSRQRTRECGPDQHTSPPHQNIPTRGCRKGSMNRPSPFQDHGPDSVRHRRASRRFGPDSVRQLDSACLIGSGPPQVSSSFGVPTGHESHVFLSQVRVSSSCSGSCDRCCALRRVDGVPVGERHEVAVGCAGGVEERYAPCRRDYGLGACSLPGWPGCGSSRLWPPVSAACGIGAVVAYARARNRS